MKNKNILIICMLIGILMAKPVDLEKAQRVALSIYLERSENGSLDDFNVRSVDMLTSDLKELVYVFHLEPEGFILIPSDDRVTPILAYSFKSPFEMEDIPSNISWMLDAYKGMVKDVMLLDQSATEKVNAEWEKYLMGQDLNSRDREIKGPLLLSHWNQSGSWNDYCPGGTDCEGDQVPSGCVAVSMAAIMHYWQYPAIGSGSNSCYCGGWGTQSANFGDMNFETNEPAEITLTLRYDYAILQF